MVAQMLSPAQRAALFDPPSDPAAIERLYTLGPDDLIEVFRSRRPANRIGYAVQLDYLRHSSRTIKPCFALLQDVGTILVDRTAGLFAHDSVADEGALQRCYADVYA